MYHICDEACFCQVLSSNLVEQLEIEAPVYEGEEEELYRPDQELTSRMDEWWEDLEEIGGEG